MSVQAWLTMGRSLHHARRGARLIVVAATLLGVAPREALAHLGLRRSTPSHGAHLAVAPRQIRLTFTEPIEAAVARLRLVGPSGAAIPLSASRQPGDSAQLLVADVLGQLEGGVYTLEWQVVGKDGHPVRGTIKYVVAPGATGLADPAAPDRRGGAAPGAATASDTTGVHHDPTALPSGPYFDAESPGYVVVRALQFAALLVVIGALAFVLVVLGLFRRAEPDANVVSAMRARAAALGSWAASALLVTAALRLYAQSLAMHGAEKVLDPLFVGAMVVKTLWGYAWLIQVAASVTAIVGFALARRDRPAGWVIAAIAGVALAITPALSGHAASTPGLTIQAVVSDTLHVIGAAGWLGSLLFVLVVGMPVALRLGADRKGGTFARLVNAFSPTALVFAGLATLTGLFAAWLHIGFSSALWTSDYGRMLLIKLAILSIALLAGAYNWLRVKPTLGDDAGAMRIRRSATIELGIGVLVVIVTAILVATPPPMETDSGDRASSHAEATT
jgi:copper transport protein